MTAYFLSHITIGPHSWTVENGDPAAVGDMNPAYSLQLGWVMPEGDLHPTQPEPLFADLVLHAPDIDAFEADIGSDVALTLTFDNSNPAPFTFYGRITDCKATPAPKTFGGMLVSLVALDYTVDERPIGLVDWPAETFAARLARVFAEAGAGAVPTLGLVGDPGAPSLPARSASRTTLPAYLGELLPSWIGLGAGDAYGRYILAPNIAGGSAPLPAQQFALDPVTEVTDYPLPAEFALLPSTLYGPDFAPAPADFVLDGRFVRRSVNWSRRKFGNHKALVVTDPNSDAEVFNIAPGAPGSAGAPTDPPLDIFAELASAFPLPFGTEVTGAMTRPAFSLYLRDVNGAGNRWAVDGFTYELSRDLEDADPDSLDAADMVPGWMPLHEYGEGVSARTRAYHQTVVVTGIPADQNPASGTVYAGQLMGATLRLTGGRNPRAEIDFTVRRGIPRPAPGDALTPGGLGASPLAAVTVAQLDPDYTPYDYRLIREA